MADTDPDRLEEVLKGRASLNDTIAVAPLTTQFQFVPDTTFPSTQTFDASSVWYLNNGGDISGAGTAGLNRLIDLSTDGAQTDSSAAVETAPISVYRSGAKTVAATGVWFDVLPTGDAKCEVTYGREPRTLTTEDGENIDVGTEYYTLRAVEDTSYDPAIGFEFEVGTDIDGDGTAETNTIALKGTRPGGAVDLTGSDPKATFYVIDPLDGNGPSGVDYDPRQGYIYGFIIGWYGPSAVVPFIVATANISGNWNERVWPIGLYQPHEDPSIIRPNQPIRTAVDNGTSGQSLAARIGGRQSSFFGDVAVTPTPTQSYVRNQSHDSTVGTEGDESGSNWEVAAVIKRRADRPGTALGVLSESIATESGLSVQARVVPEPDISGTLSYGRPSDHERAESALLVDQATDTPTRLSIGTETKDNGDTVLVGKKVDGDLVGTGKNDLTLGETEGSFAFPIVRTHPTVILFSVRPSSTTTDVDWSFKVVEEG